MRNSRFSVRAPRTTIISSDGLERLSLRPSEAARVIGVTPKTLSNWRGRGKGPSYVRVGQRGIFYRIEDLDAWLSSQVVGGAA
ncbi:Hypothetical protein CGLY_11740 [Corynebacterium glyciniphilum AJ 3170]|uniref:Helix-turn-helix domain-containing protein n=1 Tax=Corynebacterium glyciniphilum AJ 3170 TaxID=1404245 RepID=X5DNS3_9CORY|nr:Hypothetical protein CGLY_11740 [Corynebacterium glyciniphilum AJ 3170]